MAACYLEHPIKSKAFIRQKDRVISRNLLEINIPIGAKRFDENIIQVFNSLDDVLRRHKLIEMRAI